MSTPGNKFFNVNSAVTVTCYHSRLLQWPTLYNSAINQKTLYVIEPVIESLLQVPNQKFSMLVKIHKLQIFVQSVILYMVMGPGETSQNGEFF